MRQVERLAVEGQLQIIYHTVSAQLTSMFPTENNTINEDN